MAVAANLDLHPPENPSDAKVREVFKAINNRVFPTLSFLQAHFFFNKVP